MTKYLIVNADDFGYSYSVNKGIVEAHTEALLRLRQLWWTLSLLMKPKS